MIRILVVDPFEHIRRMIRALLETQPEWLVCGEAANGQGAIDQCELLRPNVVILDIQLPVVSGLEAARQILLRIPGMLILLLTLDDSAHFVLAELACGAQGLLVKGRATEDMVAAVSALLQGRKYFAGVRRAPPGGVSAAISWSNLDARPLF